MKTSSRLENSLYQEIPKRASNFCCFPTPQLSTENGGKVQAHFTAMEVLLANFPCIWGPITQIPSPYILRGTGGEKRSQLVKQCEEHTVQLKLSL